MAQWVKGMVLEQLWHRLQLWLGFSSWTKNFHVLWVWPEKRKKPSENQLIMCVIAIMIFFVKKNLSIYQNYVEI